MREKREARRSLENYRRANPEDRFEQIIATRSGQLVVSAIGAALFFIIPWSYVLLGMVLDGRF